MQFLWHLAGEDDDALVGEGPCNRCSGDCDVRPVKYALSDIAGNEWMLCKSCRIDLNKVPVDEGPDRIEPVRQ